MLNSRRLWTGTALVGAFTVAVLFVGSPADGQFKQPVPFPGGPIGKPVEGPKKGDQNSPSHFSAIKLIENDKVQQYLDLAREYIAGKSWKNAVQALQAILDGREDLKGDFYVQVKRFDPRTGDERIRWASAKYEANALLGSMSPAGLEVYEVDYGAEARRLLNEAKKKSDREILADVAQRYMHTRAGMEANELLATMFLDRGQFFNAALRFERLLNVNETRYKASDLTLFKAALSYRRAGDAKSADRIWARLEPRLRRAGGLRIGEDTVATARIRQVLEQIPAAPPANPHDWIMVAGNLTRSAQAVGSPPLLDEVLWFRKTIQDKNDETGEVERGQEAKLRIEAAVKATRSMNPPVPVMPGFFPIAAGGKVIYRSYLGISAVNVNEVRDNDGKILAKPGDIEWKSTDFEGSLAVLLSDLKMSGTVNNWLSVYGQSHFLNLLYENSAVGTLSTDNRLVYAVDDLAVPSPPAYLQAHIWNQTAMVDDKIKPLVKGNSLQAFELETGKIAFRIGGSEMGKNEQDKEFFESHFLGVPLAVGGKLYVLNEKSDGQLRLFTIDVRSETREGNTRYTPVIVPPIQVLGTVAEHHRVTHDIARRATAVHLAYGEGILVCPTNAGELLGVDLVSRTLAWAYPYRQSAPAPGSLVRTDPRFGMPQPGTPVTLTYANWKVSPPVIVDGKVVFTAPDSIAVHCINLRDGTPVWNIRQQENDLFFAGVFDGKALIVGKNSVRAYSLAKGDHLWTLPTGDMPSGQGVASKNIYYLPLQKGEIVAIDVSRGVIKAHNRAANASEAPGNLVFYEGAVLSQTIDKVVAYPQLTAKLDLAAKAVVADPNNLEKLALRGELYLRDGQIQQAVDDLRAVWHKKPQGDLQKRVRRQLYNAFTDLMQVDFKNARTKYLDEYRALCKVPDNAAEQEHREAQLLRILGQGLESEGDLVGAFKAYREFGSLPLYRSEGIPAIDDPGQKIPSNVWLRGRVMNMLAKATPAQKRPLQDKIAEEWKAVEARNDVEAVRSFVGMFDVPFQVGREARLKLADLIIERKDRPAYLEAELDLQQLLASGLKDDPHVGGRALDTLARLEMARGTGDAMRIAMSYYKELATAFPKAAIRGTQTGTDLFRGLLADKRFLAYVSEGDTAWPKGEIKAREMTGKTLPNVEGCLFEPTGDVPPALRQYRIALDALRGTPALHIVDMTTNKARGEPIPLGNVPLNSSFYQFLYRQVESNQAYYPDARFRYFHTQGHLAVVQIGTVVYGIDLSNAKLLWQHKLLEMNGPLFNPQVAPDANGNLWVTMFNPRGGQPSRTAVGNIGAVEASYVALTTHKGLVLLDPLRGTPLWSKVGVRPQTEIFGDGEYLYLVDADSSRITGPSLILRASDGTQVEAKDFTNAYRNRLRVVGRRILVADHAGGLTLRLYDALKGKDLWKQTFPAGSVALHTVDPNLTGAIEPNGQIHVVDLSSRKEVLKANLLQYQIEKHAEELKQLEKPLLLADKDRFYVALNTPVNASQIAGGVLANNFRNGLRCVPVNGWFCALDRKTGEFAWHVEERVKNQMIVLEQFQRLPMLLFSVRYFENNQPVPGRPFRGQRMVWSTMTVNKETGSVIYGPPEPQQAQGQSAQFLGLTIDEKAGTVNLFGYNYILQHYVNDGRKRTEDGVKPGHFGEGGTKGDSIAPTPLPPKFGPGPIRPNLRPKGAALPRLRLEAVPAKQPPVIQRQRVVLPKDR